MAKLNICWPEALKSRKFWLAVLSGLLIAFNNFFEWGLSQAELDKILIMVGGYIFVEGGADIVSRYRSAER